METPHIDESRPGVWMAWGRSSSLPSEFRNVHGLIVNIDAWKDLPFRIWERDAVLPCTVWVVAWDQQFRVEAKITFLDRPQGPNLDTQQEDREVEERVWMPLPDFKSRLGQFAVLIGNRRAYQEIFHILGAELAKRLLLLINELVVLNELRPSARILRQIRGSEQNLWAQFFREDEERFALVDFRRSVQAIAIDRAGLEYVDWLEAEVPLWRGKFVLPLRLNFPEVLGQQQLMNVVIGPNGTGKTTLLLGLAKAVVDGDVHFGATDMPSTSLNVRSPSGSSPPLRVSVFTYERSMWASLRRKGVSVYEQGVRSSDWRQLTQLIHQIVTSGEEIKSGLSDLRLLAQILEDFLEIGELWLPLHMSRPGDQDSRWDDPFEFENEISLSHLTDLSEGRYSEVIARLDRGSPPFMRDYGGQKYALSSGQRSLVLFCTRLMTASADGALVLVDEPENHLHPYFITLMIQALARTLQATGSRALVVTHSPFVVREFEKSTVKVMKISPEGAPEIFRPSLQTFGADVSMISDYVFEDEAIRKGFQNSIDRAVRARQRRGGAKPLQGLAADLGEDGLSYLIEKTQAETNGTSNA